MQTLLNIGKTSQNTYFFGKNCVSDFFVITGKGFELNSDSFFAKSHLEPNLAKNDVVLRILGGGGERILHAKVL